MAETQFGRYQLLELLGRGGMGEVWRAHDTATDRIVALKLLAAHLSHDEVFQERFRREAHAAARLNNPHVIPIHFYGEIDGRLFVDMRLIEGRDLATVLDDGPLEPSRAVRIIEQVAKALHAAHKVGLVHRDVKPSNTLLDEDDFAYLIDFGIARAANETGLTASRPFPGDGLEQQYGGHVATPPPRPSTTAPTVPAAFDEVIATGMAKDPDDRYAATVALARAAQDAITTPIPRAAPTVAPPPPPEPPTVPAAPPTVVGASASAPTQQRQPHEVPTLRAPDRAPPRAPAPSTPPPVAPPIGGHIGRRRSHRRRRDRRRHTRRAASLKADPERAALDRPQ